MQPEVNEGNGSHGYITQVKQCIEGEVVSFNPNCKLLGVGIAEGSQQTCHKEEELYRVQG